MDVKRPKPELKLLRKRNLFLIFGSLTGVAAIVLLLNLGQATASVERDSLWIDAAVRGDMVREIRASGVLVPRDVRWVTAGTSATVQQVLVQPGQPVQPDTVILRLSNPAVEANLTKAIAAQAGADAELAAVRSQLHLEMLDQKSAVASAQAAAETSRIRAEAMERAFASGVISRIELEERRIGFEQNRNLLANARQRESAFSGSVAAQLRAAQAKRDETTSSLAVARQDADALEVRAGLPGILQQIGVEPGQQVEVGANLARVARPEPLIARLQVPEIHAKDLAPGLPVKVDTRNGIVEGRISLIDPAVRNGSVRVDVEFSGPLPEGARPDLSVDGRIILGTLRNVVSIGRPALGTPDGNGLLFVLDEGDDVAHRKRVVFGAASSERIVVLEGIAPGQQVILSDTGRWNDQQTLRLK